MKSLFDDEILQTRIKDLNLILPDEKNAILSRVSERLDQLNIEWKPHTWFSEEWFSPDGVGGFAIPFMLAHPKLIKLEKKYLGFCEGESSREFYKLCCHETAHALDNAYKLRLSKKRQSLFGKTSKKYPQSYTPRHFDQNYVDFLGDYYGQAHPDEDWAETIGHLLYYKNLGKKYQKTQAWKKLILAKEILHKLEEKTFKKTSHKTPYHYTTDTRTIETYLREKKRRLHLSRISVFSPAASTNFTLSTKNEKVETLINFHQKDIIQKVSKQSGMHIWLIEQCILNLKKECKEKQYHLKYNYRNSLLMIEKLVTNHLDEFIKKGHTRIYM